MKRFVFAILSIWAASLVGGFLLNNLGVYHGTAFVAAVIAGRALMMLETLIFQLKDTIEAADRFEGL